ncbi:hypothetical protein HYH03_002706 [Edaphochlamys debaryana]|uniref:Pseudouridine synthase RsuA/RluA-like domain-containing protein n=1 Tax=Edaphochlamys debaryana TaxID=47281 RepID=A0A836C4P5_9CHLO|nr:hypothetical protein HYH03_002706 [Edaphochlamys debaryana]|eukprot:KAG2499123.1 hypothetical protein HYH03_002706 [Edaphochlamys debaryana]
MERGRWLGLLRCGLAAPRSAGATAGPDTHGGLAGTLTGLWRAFATTPRGGIAGSEGRSRANANASAGPAGRSRPAAEPQGGRRDAAAADPKPPPAPPKAPSGSLTGLTGQELLQRFEGAFRRTPPVSFIRGMQPPSALSWLRRRGPDVPHAALQRVFRQRQVRLFDGERVVRATAARPLRNGEVLLYPASLVSWQEARQAEEDAAHGPLTSPSGRDGGSSGSGSSGSGSGRSSAKKERLSRASGAAGGDPSSEHEDEVTATRTAGSRRSGLGPPGPSTSGPGPHGPASALSPERVRRWVLGVHPGLVFLNKPSGVLVHGRSAGDDDGGRGGGGLRGRGRQAAAGGGLGAAEPLVLDGALRQGLRYGEHDEPRLVHRLDQQASGVMVVARDADAAAWLSAAFRNKSQRAVDGIRHNEGPGEEEEEEEEEEVGGAGGPERRGVAPGDPGYLPPDLFVRRTYWAFLAGNLQPRQSGRIRSPVLVDGVFCPAVTQYRVRGTGCGVTWVELQPETGRRHQLRVHCARKLGAPIIGDLRHGYRGLPPRLALRDNLPPEWWALLGDDPRAARRDAAALGGGGGGGGPAEALLPPPPPLLLHSRELLVKRPGKAPLVGVAPLPRYVRELIQAAGWPMPSLG